MDYNSFTDKVPFGPVTVGQPVSVKVSTVTPVDWVVVQDGQWQNRQVLPLTLDPKTGTASGSFTPGEGGLWFYYFLDHATDPATVYGTVDGGEGGNGAVYPDEMAVQMYQQTVVYQQEQVPEWYKTARGYHIFVDRFNNGNADGHVNAPKPNSFLYGQLSDKPFYIKQPDGAIARWDFYGGNLLGITQKLPELAAFGINLIYLSPIFEARSNHRYDTGDYLKIDPMLGTEADFKQLLATAHGLGMHVLLDGVFNHVGQDSRYFNAFNHYADEGAANSQASPYYDWFTFTDYPTEYASWWGVKDLPAINKDARSFHDFIANSEDSVIRYWSDMGVDGWRLDVADELADDFLYQIRHTLSQLGERLLIGEVWEDASHKIAYGQRRPYLLGGMLQAVMNYPLRQWLLNLVNQTEDAATFLRHLMTMKANYPPATFAYNFNNLGSHDTKRLRTAAASDAAERLAVLLLFTLPGIPVIYYGDEAGLTGGSDPDNRAYYPWGREDLSVKQWFATGLQWRQQHPALAGEAAFYPFTFGAGLGFFRQSEAETVLILVNPTTLPLTLTPGILDLTLIPAALQALVPAATVAPQSLNLQIVKTSH